MVRNARCAVVGQRDRVVDGMDLLEELANIGAGDETLGSLAGEDHGGHVLAARQVFDNRVQLV